MIVRVALLLLLVLAAVLLVRAYGPRLVRNPYWRQILSQGLVQVARLYLLRRGVPLLLRVLRMARFFR